MNEETVRAATRVREAEKAHSIRTFSKRRGAKNRDPDCIQIRVLIWQIMLIWIPLHPALLPGVHITVGRGASGRRRGAFPEGGVHQFTGFRVITLSNRRSFSSEN